MRWIGVIHLPPLPGGPVPGPPVPVLTELAVQEARRMARNGAAGILLENYGDRPLFKDRVSSLTVAAMAVITRAVVTRVEIPVGVNLLRNAAGQALAVAVAGGASFLRVNVWTGAAVTDQGVIEGPAAAVLRRRRAWRAEHIRIMADVRVKHARPLAPISLEEEMDSLVHRGRADAVIVTGERTGVPPDPSQVQTVRRLAPPGLEVWLGSGARPDNVTVYQPWIDGIIIGSYLRRNGRPGEPLSRHRLQRWAEAVRRLGQPP